MINVKSPKLLIPLLTLTGLVAAYGIFALTEDDIVYPIAELGGCQNEQACFAYCDAPENINECIDFAEKYNLLSEEELGKAKKFREIGAVGPGGCTTEPECETYCSEITHIEECLLFAEQHDFMEEDELDEAKKIAELLKQGVQLPGGCTTKDQCETYCNNPDNMKECIEFAEQAGFLPPEELKEAKQVLKAIEAGVPFPGGCRGKDECDAYCEEPTHIEECIEFAIAAGFIPQEEVEEILRILPIMKAGRMPGGCTSEQSCEAYCSDEANLEECTAFFVEAGFMTAEEAEMFRKTGGKGPGGCTGERECEDFCNNPQNQQACFEFALEYGLIPEEELEQMRQGVQEFKEMIETAPPEVVQCLQEKMGQEVLDQIEEGTFMPTQEMGEHMWSCFDMMHQMMQQQMQEQFFACLQLPCEEMIYCVDSVSMSISDSGGGGSTGSEEEGLPPAWFAEIDARIDACMQEQMMQEVQRQQEEMEWHIQQQMQQEMQRQMEMEMQQQWEEEKKEPQSFYDLFRNMLAMVLGEEF